MSLSSTNIKNVYSGNASQTAWPYTFPIILPTDIRVTLFDPDGVGTVLSSNYEVDPILLQVVYPTVVSGLPPLPSGWEIVLQRVEPLTQELFLQRLAPFNATNIMDALDKLTMISQELSEGLNRAIKYPVNETPTDSTTTTFISTVTAAAATAVAAASAASSSATAAAASAAKLSGTSTSTVLIGTGSKSFTTQAGKFFDVGMFLLITSDANTANYMHGQVTAYSGTSLTVNVTNVGGAGSLADWTIRVSGTRGAIGATGATGPAGSGSGDVLGPATNTADFIPQWNGANSKTLKDGLQFDTDGALTANSDTRIASQKATKTYADLKAAKGANSDITSLSALSTPLSVAQGGSGRATLAAHGVLIGNGTTGILVTGAGTAGQVLTSNGASADPTFQAPPPGAGAFIKMTVFTSSGTWTRDASTTRVIAEVVGGGGGGGGGTSGDIGSGGGGGGYSMRLIAAPGATETVTIGAGGAGGSDAAGATGGTSSFGAWLSATGGVGGNQGSGSAVAGGAGGAGASGDLNLTGQDGHRSRLVMNTGSPYPLGAGGGNAARGFGFGAPDRTTASTGNGVAGISYGGGGSGSLSSSAQPGGAGAPGIVIVWEYS